MKPPAAAATLAGGGREEENKKMKKKKIEVLRKEAQFYPSAQDVGGLFSLADAMDHPPAKQWETAIFGNMYEGL